MAAASAPPPSLKSLRLRLTILMVAWLTPLSLLGYTGNNPEQWDQGEESPLNTSSGERAAGRTRAIDGRTENEKKMVFGYRRMEDCLTHLLLLLLLITAAEW